MDDRDERANRVYMGVGRLDRYSPEQVLEPVQAVAEALTLARKAGGSPAGV